VEGLIRLDTHVVVWLYTGQLEALSARTITAIEQHQPAISPIVQLELDYLHEIGRLLVGGGDIVADLSRRIGLHLSDVALDALVPVAAALSWTRDPFDRLIVADALVVGASLVTKDRAIHDHTQVALW
jgi:PIN domain nuclease of toxin-antitoxin system